jgi:probable phosphoglycerate mutase
MQSAVIIAQSMGCEIFIMPEFTERSMGIFEGLSRNEAKCQFPFLHCRDVMHNFGWAPPQGETIIEVAKRVQDGLLNICQDYSEPVILVTHGTVAKIIHWLFGKMSDKNFFKYSLANGAFKVYKLTELKAQKLLCNK